MAHNLARQTLRIFWQHAWKYKVYVIGLIVVSPLTLLFHQILPPLIASRILEKLSNGQYIFGDLWGSMGHEIALYAAVIIFGNTVMWRLSIYLIWRLEMLVQRDLAQDMFDHLMELDMNFHANSFGGSLVSRTNKFIGAYMRIADTIVFQIYNMIIMLVFTSVIMWGKSPQYVITLLLCSLGYVIISVFVTGHVRKLNSIAAAAENKQTGTLADMVTNVLAVKSFATEKFEHNRFVKVTENTHQMSRKVMRATIKRDALFGLTTTSIQAGALTIAAAAVILYRAEIGSVFLILYYTNNITVRLWDFSQQGLRNLNRGLGDAQEATDTLLTNGAIANVKKPQKLKVSKGAITFDHVVFSHDQTKLFKDLNLQIKPGEKIGLVGPSGGGKTTITKLLLRFMDIQDGAIRIDDQDIASLRQQDVRSIISYVPQEPLLFHRSLRENIAYGRQNADESAVIAASKKAHAHEFITQLPDTYETLVGERGVKLSGGQKQRVAIARAMIKDAPILVLDEATSALDSESEQLIQDALWKLMKGKTAIVIAHRLSTIQKMDRIIVLDKGAIVEEGSHSELLKKKSGHYARLWAHQSGGFLE